uniref:Tetratricopeptide repeat protein 16 isoform X1 n=1 Tax=Petromyzon marinus TaxID=7757 RepID=A0AAJ7TB37_PETMA|nr:tetratricopeptide repeat protein 16 isoform X1 [Petromyzon marinus]XP_032814585.1 tetratricopeptide repeat protein 16 isoform X1 [Petromyzon marinus]XP_032814586.1 tetratricopeptide repeat protein 16 isoform X1 [Petromyzon marinus]XP_032814587.1 tetratricopeptide repeat protein 16 isoform X1 [Petromyzon marinus]XP_032814588.1 tetratricopeptide repeat protein 16 isoform X1 [Petromyzon marinus]
MDVDRRQDNGEESCSTQAEDEQGAPPCTFPTAVSEEQLEGARKRARNRLQFIGSGAVFLLDDGRGQRAGPSMQNVLEEKARQHYMKGLEEFNHGEYEKAVLCFTKAINLTPQQTDLYVKRAEAYLELCDFQSAILGYKQALSVSRGQAPIHGRLASIYCIHGQGLFEHKLYLDALEAFTRATELKPSSLPIEMRCVACLAALGRYGDCLELVDRWLLAETDNADLYVLRARLHHRFNNPSRCHEDAREAARLAPGRAEAEALLESLRRRAQDARVQAVAGALRGRPREALAKISLAVESDPGAPEHRVLRAALLRQLQDFAGATEELLAGMEAAGHDPESTAQRAAQRQLLIAYNDLAVHCCRRGLFQEAVVLLNRAIRAEKGAKSLYRNRGDCFYKMDELGFALADYQQAYELDPGDSCLRERIALVHHDLAVMDHQEKRYAEAERRCTEAIRNHPGLGAAYVQRAMARQMMQESAGARLDVVTALLIQPSNQKVLPMLSQLFPGKSVGDVMASEFARAAAAAAAATAATARSPAREAAGPGDSTDRALAPPRGHRTGSTTGEGTPQTFQLPGTGDATNGVASRVPDSRLIRKLMAEKKKADVDVRRALMVRASLSPAVPRLRVVHEASGTQASGTDRPYMWRTFSQHR